MNNLPKCALWSDCMECSIVNCVLCTLCPLYSDCCRAHFMGCPPGDLSSLWCSCAEDRLWQHGTSKLLCFRQFPSFQRTYITKKTVKYWTQLEYSRGRGNMDFDQLKVNQHEDLTKKTVRFLRNRIQFRQNLPLLVMDVLLFSPIFYIKVTLKLTLFHMEEIFYKSCFKIM